jgi:hypothetical protein
LPVPLDRRRRKPERGGDLGYVETPKELELYDLRPAGLGCAKPHERVVEHQHVDDREVAAGDVVIQRDVRGTAALLGIANSRVIDENPTHGARCGAQEVDSVVRRERRAAEEAKIGFVNERRWLERVIRSLAAHVPAGNRVQLGVDDTQQFLEGVRVTVAGVAEEATHGIHGGAFFCTHRREPDRRHLPLSKHDGKTRA